MSRLYRLGLLGCAATVLLTAGQDPTRAALARMPLRFEANQGQFNPEVSFAARGAGYSFALTNHGVSMTFGQSAPVRLSMVGANPAAHVEGVGLLADKTDYFIGHKENWHPGVASYERVRYVGAYPGIDLVFYGNGESLEYDLVLQPGADPDAIRLRFSGPAPVRITAAGDLAVLSADGLVLQQKPAIYQQDRNGIRHAVAGRYVMVGDNEVGVRLGGYDRSQALVIDPQISYSTLIGGHQTDQVVAMKATATRLYIAAWTQTGDLATTDLPYNNLTDTYLQIVDTTSAGAYKVLYSTYLGGTNLDIPTAIDVDALGFFYVTGTTTSTDFPVSGNSVQTTGAATSVSGYVVKIDPNQAGTGNSLVYSTFLGGTAGDSTPKGMQVGTDGFIYIVGTTKAPDFPTTDNAYASSLYGPSDVFISKIDVTNTNLLYSSFIGSELDDDAAGMVLGPNNVVYFAATTLGVQFATAGAAYSGASAGQYDIIVAAMDTGIGGTAGLTYSTYFGGSGSDAVKAIALDAKGRIVITGYTLSTDFPVTATTAMQPTYAGNGDAFVSIFDTTQPGTAGLYYSTFLGGSEGEVGYGLATDPQGFVYVTGYTLSPDFPLQNPIQGNWGGGVDMFVTRLMPGVAGLNGLDYSTYIGIDSTIVGTSLALDPAENLYVGGYAEGYLPLVGQGWQENYGGGTSDGFFFVIPGTGPPATTMRGPLREERLLGEPPNRIVRRR